jgi:hypothetical protein
MPMRSVYFGDLGQREPAEPSTASAQQSYTTHNSALAGEATSPDEDERLFVAPLLASPPRGPALRTIAGALGTA